MAIPKATPIITKPCRTTSKALKFHNASSNATPAEVVVEPEIDRKIAGKDKSAPAMMSKSKVFRGVFFAGFWVSISPDRKRIANVPAPTANWKIAT